MNGTFFCNKCGAQNAAGAQFCARCGASTAPAPGVIAPPTGSPVAAAPYVAPAYTAAPYTVPATAYPVVAYGGFWIRVAAAVIDFIIVRVVVSPIKFIFGGFGLAGMMSGVPRIPLLILGGGVTFIAMIFASWLYEAFMESSSYQATLGKMICALKVTDLNGNRISFERATVRYFAKWLSKITFGIGYLMVGFTERKQGLHDLLAETLVRKV
jgi:uncharacterized RDD family membrane protein YckC